MGVTVHVAPHPDALVAMLCERLRLDPADPFTPELIAVPTRGIERWLTQRIALELADVAGGIAANIEFPSPRELVREVVSALPELSTSLEAWEGPALQAAVMSVIDAELDASWMALLRRHLTAPSSSRMAAAAKIARLFSSYGRRRPDMIEAWVDGRDVGPDAEPLDSHHLWQPQLWRSVRALIGVPSISELGASALDPLRAGVSGLPERLSVYGLTASDPFDLEVLSAVGETTDVHVHVLHPSPALWEQVARHDMAVTDRTADPSSQAAAHPLLKTWARDSRELQLVLSRVTSDVQAGLAETGGEGTEPTTLLARLQSDIRQNRLPTPSPPDAMDRSVQIHVCHGARRQVEVLRDAILHILADDPTLEPRDIVIMTPDLAGFAPLLEAGFPREQSDEPSLPDLRVRIADRSPSATNPLVRFAAGVLDMAESRMEAAVIRELVTRPVVQNRFGFDADTAGAIVRIIDDATIAWGLDAEHRRPWGVDDIPERTWRRGLDRALTGVFYGDSPVRVTGDVAPLDGVEGQDARPVGILSSIIDRIAAIRRRLSQPLPLSEWAEVVGAATRLLADPGWDDEWQWNQLERLLSETFPTTDADPMVTLTEARQAMTAWTDDRPSPLMFRTGDVTVCTLVPMRSVPYRVVCLLGMDDERFPRRGRSDGDDLLVGHERIGDHDRAGEDRQLLLDAVMSAGDHLVITYSGRDEITNAEYPPAVPVAEFTDVLATMTGAPAHHLETRHPLQSFSEAVFTDGALGVTGPWGFDSIQLAGAHAIQQRMQPSLGIEEPWPSLDPPEIVRLSDLAWFLTNPVKGFVRATLGFGIPEVAELPDDALPVELGGLESWALKDRLIEGLARGHDLDELMSRERAADSLPPAKLAQREVERARTDVEALWSAATGRGYHRAHHQRYTGRVSVNGRLVEGSVVADPLEAHLPLITPSRIKASHRLRSFAELCFLSMLEPERPWHVLMLTKQARGRGFLEVTIGPLADTADERRSRGSQLLWGLVSLYDDGHRAPMALPCETGLAWQRKVVGNRNGAAWDARDKFERDRYSAEREDPAHRLVFPDVMTVDDLLVEGLEDRCERLWAPMIPIMKDVAL